MECKGPVQATFTHKNNQGINEVKVRLSWVYGKLWENGALYEQGIIIFFLWKRK